MGSPKPKTKALPSQATGLVISAILSPSRSHVVVRPTQFSPRPTAMCPFATMSPAATMRTLVHNYPYAKPHPDFRCSVCEWTYNLAHRSFVLDYLEEREARRAFDAHNCSDFSPM